MVLLQVDLKLKIVGSHRLFPPLSPLPSTYFQCNKLISSYKNIIFFFRQHCEFGKFFSIYVLLLLDLRISDFINLSFSFLNFHLLLIQFKYRFQGILAEIIIYVNACAIQRLDFAEIDFFCQHKSINPRTFCLEARILCVLIIFFNFYNYKITMMLRMRSKKTTERKRR